MRYVYPVVSRRAGGVSIGINLNPNNACNWRCIYCQVPGLKRGGPPPLDLHLLEKELTALLEDVLHGEFMARQVPPEARRLNDIAFSGNGEPTSAKEYPEAVAVVGEVMKRFDLTGTIRLVLITNGSLIHRPEVQEGLRRMAGLGGETWFKLDRATPEGWRMVNGTENTPAQAARHLQLCAGLCPTWLQTCVFALDGSPPPEKEIHAYLDFVAKQLANGVVLRGVHLYGLARPPMQEGAERLSPVSGEWMAAFAARIEALGLTVKASP